MTAGLPWKRRNCGPHTLRPWGEPALFDVYHLLRGRGVDLGRLEPRRQLRFTVDGHEFYIPREVDLRGCAFRINDSIGSFIKYASAPKGRYSEYLFTFQKAHLDELALLHEKSGKVSGLLIKNGGRP